MNGAYLHLSINHIPVVGFPMSLIVLLAGALRRSRDLIQAGFAGVVLVAIITAPVWKTGGAAARVVRNYPGATIVREQVHEHAEAGEFGAVGAGILGVIALLGWWLSRRPEGAPKALVALVIFGTLFVSSIMVRVAHLGGLIRHPEIMTSTESAPMTSPAAVPRLPTQ